MFSYYATVCGPLVAQFGGGGGAARPAGVHPVWLVLPIVIALAAVTLSVWLAWRMRVVTKAIRYLEAGGEYGKILPAGFGLSPRFKLRTMLGLLTIGALLLGMFAAELNRARRQGDALARLATDGSAISSDGSQYRLGLLGDSKTAELINLWVHPHFGSHLTQLALGPQGRGWTSVPPVVLDETKALGRLTELEELRIYNRRLTEDEIDAIARLPRLKSLIVTQCYLPPRVLNLLQPARRLQVLELDGCHLWDEDLEGLDQLQQLRELSLGENNLTDDCLPQIGKLPQLRTLLIAQNKITSAGLEHLKPMKSLTDLSVALTEVDAGCGEVLAHLPRLRYLNLAGCNRIMIAEADGVEADLAANPRLDIEWVTPRDRLQLDELQDNRPVVRDMGGGGAF